MKNKVPLFDIIKRYRDLHAKIYLRGPEKNYTQEELTEYLSYGHSLSTVDIISFLIDIVDNADLLAKEALQCEDYFTCSVKGTKTLPCVEKAIEYNQIRKKVL